MKEGNFQQDPGSYRTARAQNDASNLAIFKTRAILFHVMRRTQMREIPA